MTQYAEFDVFLAHNSIDKPQVRAIAAELKRRGLKPWVDEEQIPPGQSFQDVIQRAIFNVKSIAVFIGSKGLGKWQALEMQTLVYKSIEAGIPIIPVLLPGVNRIPDDTPFLREFHCVSFTNGIDDTRALEMLEWGITGQRPKREAQPTQAITSENFDVFLCFQGEDQSEVKRISKELKGHQIHSWPDQWELTTEVSWQKLLIKQIGKIDSLAVFVGNNGGPWEDEDVESFIWECIESGSLVVPIILASTLRDLKLPVYLRRRQIVDFRDKGSNPLAELANLIRKKVKREEGSSHG